MHWNFTTKVLLQKVPICFHHVSWPAVFPLVVAKCVQQGCSLHTDHPQLDPFLPKRKSVVDFDELETVFQQLKLNIYTSPVAKWFAERTEASLPVARLWKFWHIGHEHLVDGEVKLPTDKLLHHLKVILAFITWHWPQAPPSTISLPHNNPNTVRANLRRGISNWTMMWEMIQCFLLQKPSWTLSP